MKKISLIGHRFGKLIVLSWCYTNEYRKVFWLCRCDCGGTKIVRGNDLKNGKTKSCGCLQHRCGENNPNYKGGVCLDIVSYRRIHYTNNKEKYYAKSAKRRALKLNQTPTDANFYEISRIYKIASDLNKRANGKVKFHVDHIIPLSKGGLHHQDNLQILCAEDNFSKADKILEKDGIYYGKEDFS